MALLLFTVQPVPGNDAFFYDGAVVNFLLNGKYCNPSLIHALPISGGDVFSAYPPFHQVALLGWMNVFGTSALAAIWFHVLLLGIYFIILFSILRCLKAPAMARHVAGLFLFGITFHDRPDTLAHVCGMLALWGWVRGGRYQWLGMAGLVLAFGTSLQIGGVYLFASGLIVLANAWSGQRPFPWAPMTATGFLLLGLFALVKIGFPHLWEGFQEHLHITPSVTAWHWPTVDAMLKTIRTAPGIFAVGFLLLVAWLTRRLTWRTLRESAALRVAVGGLIAALAIASASLVKLTPNTIHIAYYLQPLIVGAFLAAGIFAPEQTPFRKLAVGGLVLTALLTSTRAIGMTTWGVWCAQDMGYRAAIARMEAEIAPLPAGTRVVASSAYLYDLVSHTNLVWIHNDWPAPPEQRAYWEADAFAKLQPARIMVTPFDYYRRFGAIFEQMRTNPNLVSMQITNLATVRPPDAYPQWQRVVQHVSWAPVIVELKWR